MPSESDIGVAALRRLGSSITYLDLGTRTKEADCFNAMYPLARDAMLTEHTWDFAAQRVRLGRMAVKPAFGYSYFYQLPPDFLRILTLWDGSDCDITDYQIEGVSGPTTTTLAVVTNADEVRLRYVADNAMAHDPNQMRVEFRNALVTRLARDMCLDIVGAGVGMRLYQLLDADYRREVAKARSIDSMSGPPVMIPTPDAVLVR